MESRTLSWIFGLVALAAIAFAVFTYANKSATPTNVISSIAPTASEQLLSEEITPTPLASLKPSTSPSASPVVTSSRVFKASQSLSLPSEIATIESGGSLSGIAEDHGLRMSQVATVNSITDPNTVYAGQTIIIPDDVTDNVYTILFVTNTLRFEKEKQKLQAGSSSLYSDAISAARIDTKGIFGLTADTPYSQSDATETAVTLSTSDDKRIVTVSMQKDTSGLWLTKKLVVKVTSS